MSLSQFDRDARRAQETVVKRATETIRAVAIDAYQTIQAEADGRSGAPVASGRLTASTRLELNEIDRSVEPPDPDYKYPKGSGPRDLPPRTIRNRPVAAIVAKLRKFKLGDRIFISNSVPYIRKIETGRHSWQTPDGVFEVSIRAVAARFRNLRVFRRG